MNHPFIYHFLGISVSLLPVFLFLVSLVILDSFKLVKIRTVLLTILFGCFVSGLCYLINTKLMHGLNVDITIYSRYFAPVIEESLKALAIVYLIKADKVGFMVDAAIFGFAAGAGFAFIENIYYLEAVEDATIFLWVVRGFGTAIMHGGVTGICSVVSKSFADNKSSKKLFIFLPGIFTAVLIHSFFNHFFFPPIIVTVIILLVLPLVFILVFNQSEKFTRR